MSDGQFIYITLALLVGGIIALYHITVKPLFLLIIKWMKRSDGKGESDNNTINEEDNQTRDLLIKTLEDIGCQYEIDDNNCIVFKYQGEEFNIDASNDNLIIWIYNIAWGSIKIDDPNVDYLKLAINKSNENCAVTSLYTIDKEQKVLNVHCRISIYFAYNIPNRDGYLRSFLDSFFHAHQQVREEFANLTKNQEQKERIKIKGFRVN